MGPGGGDPGPLLLPPHESLFMLFNSCREDSPTLIAAAVWKKPEALKCWLKECFLDLFLLQMYDFDTEQKIVALRVGSDSLTWRYDESRSPTQGH